MSDAITTLDVKSVTSAELGARRVAERIRLRLGQRFAHGAAGGTLGRGPGSSIEYHDHRAFVPGDDPRHLDWFAYARSGQHILKVYREEISPRIDVALDVSASMFLTEAKRRRTLEMFFLVRESARRLGASLRTHLVGGATARLAEDAEIEANRWISNLPVHDERPPAPGCIPWRSRAMRVWISDLLFPGEPSAILGALGMREGESTILVPYCVEEATPAWSGNCEFAECESERTHLRRIEPDVLDRYRRAYVRHFELWRHEARRRGTMWARVPSDVELQPALLHEALPAGVLELQG